MKGKTQVINVTINAGHFSGSAANQLDKKIKKILPENSWGIVQVIPNKRNLWLWCWYLFLGFLTLGFYSPMPGYAVIMEEIKN